MLGWISNILGRKNATRTVFGLRLRAKFDAAQSTPDNRRHWANADGLSADAAASPAVRQTLRNRARYEVANNSYARGIVVREPLLPRSRNRTKNNLHPQPDLRYNYLVAAAACTMRVRPRASFGSGKSGQGWQALWAFGPR